MNFKTFLNMLFERLSDYKASYKMEHKFSDVQDFVRSKKFFGHSLAGKPLKDMDNGVLWIYEYDLSGGKQNDKAVRYVVNVEHFGEVIRNFVVDLHSYNPKAEMEDMVKKMNKELPVFKAEKAGSTSAPTMSAVDYSKMSALEIVKALDKTLKDFAPNPNMTALMEIKKMRAALDDKFDLSEKGKFSSAFSTLDMYISTLNTQLSNPMVAATVSQFVDNYVSQMRAAVSEIASKI